MRKLMMLAAMLAMVMVAAVPAMATDYSYLYDLDFEDITLQNQEAENNAVQVLSANTGNNTIDQDANNVVVGNGVAFVDQENNLDAIIESGDIDQDAVQEVDQVIQQAQADDESLAFNANDVFFGYYWYWYYF